MTAKAALHGKRAAHKGRPFVVVGRNSTSSDKHQGDTKVTGLEPAACVYEAGLAQTGVGCLSRGQEREGGKARDPASWMLKVLNWRFR